MAMAIVLVLIVVGSVLFHLLSPWWWTPIATNWGRIDDTMIITFWISGAAFAAVVLFMASCVFRFRHKEGAQAAYRPENRGLESSLAVGTAVGVAVILAPGLAVWRDFVTPPPEAADVEVVGQQWQWSYRLPGKDGKLGAAETRFVSDKNPLGLNPYDTNGRDDLVISGGDLHLPVGKPVKVLLRSIDVIHNFYVPEFRAKMDLMPGIVTQFWITPTKVGTFEVLCAGFCGVGHPQMRGAVVVEPESDYRKWLGAQKTFSQIADANSEAKGRLSKR